MALVFVIRWKKSAARGRGPGLWTCWEFRTRVIGAALSRADTKQQQYYSFGYTGVPALSEYYRDQP